MNNQEERYLITQEQYDGLQEELKYYIEVKRKEVIERIREAKTFGDLSENSEYDSAREEQGFIEVKIAELENTLKNSEIIKKDQADSQLVSLGNKVTFEEVKTSKKQTYRIVGINPNPLDKKDPTISMQTPIAKAMLGAKKGDIVQVQLPNKKMDIKIIKIQ